MNKYKAGRHFLQIPGPTNVPEEVLNALSMPTIDHRGPEFQELGIAVLDSIRKVFKTKEPVIIFPSSGSGAWEASLVNVLSSGDKLLMFETGHFATLWKNMAERLGFKVDFIESDWRRGADPDVIYDKLAADKNKEIKAVAIVHNETSTGVTSRINDIRQAINSAKHDALFLVDTISSLGSIDFRHDEWGVDVTVTCSQKGLMLPPGLGFNAVSEKALKASESNNYPRSYWSWAHMIESNKTGYFPYTPSTNLLYGLKKALEMLLGEGLENIFKRHIRYGEATREAVKAWGLEIQCLDEREYSSIVTSVRMPENSSADALRKMILEKFNMSLGSGLSRLKDRLFRIGHLGYFNDLALMGTLCGIEMGMKIAKVPFNEGGVMAAMKYMREADFNRDGDTKK